MLLLKSTKYAYIVVSAAMIVLGILMLVFPMMSTYTLCYILGGIVAVFGVVKIIGYFSGDTFELAFQFDLAFGIFMLIVGLVMLLHPVGAVTSITSIAGAYILIDGAMKIQTAMDSKKFGLESWWVVLIFAVLTCIFGGILMLNPFEGTKLAMILLGLTIMVDGVQNLCITAYTVRIVKKAKHKISEEEKINAEIR